MKSQATALYPFVPSGPDFETSLAFFAEIGFDAVWKGDSLAGLKFGAAYFMLQANDVPAENQMITFEVDDLQAYWSEIARKELEGKYGGVRLREPTDFAWGREMHIIDPAGVCWHVRQAPAS
jgi:hypothetical protein